MSEVSHKQLVSVGRYVWLVACRCLLACCAILCPFIAVAFLFGSLVMGFCVLAPPAGTEWRWIGVLFTFLCALCAVAFGVLAIRLMKMEEKVVEVAPITRRSAHDLPSKESLVRASDAPRTGEQTELLRAVHEGTNTRADELLRATSTDRQAL
jgi:hypothetical protein